MDLESFRWLLTPEGQAALATAEQLYGDRVDDAQSTALFSAQGFAMIAVASRDPNRFYPGMGTLFLRMMGESLGAALSRYVD